MIKIITLSAIFIILAVASCQDHDTIGKIVIEYDGSWTSVITQNHSNTNVNGSGKQEYKYENPDFLKASVTKQDTSNSKLTVYIYEDERIVTADYTNQPSGSVTIEYEFPF
jgi:hypothetical protein